MIHIVLGTKAQLIKMAPIMVELRSQEIPYRFISTGQHRETMSDILGNFELPEPDYYLYRGNDITSIFKMALWSIRIIFLTLVKKRAIFGSKNTGIILVHGDTLSTLIGAIMGKIARMKVGHVESGLRSHNWLHPFPEELTRVIVFNLSDYYFCPSNTAVKNLANYKGEKINTQTNTLIDALHIAETQIESSEVEIPNEKYAIASIHRFENIRNERSLTRIVELLELISQYVPRILFILHKPTEQKLKKFNLYSRLTHISNIEIRQRYDYFKFIKLVKYSEFVVSDGGSNQEECAYLGKPTLLLRKATEREDGLGSSCIVSEYDSKKITHFCENYSNIIETVSAPEQSPSKTIASRISNL